MQAVSCSSSVPPRIRRPGWRVLPLAALAFIAQTVFSSPLALAVEGDYAADIDLSALCPRGEFPVVIVRTGDTLEGTVALALDSRGALTGSLTIDGSTHVVTGRQKVRAWGQRIAFKGGLGRKRFAFSGRVENDVAAGRLRDGGTVARGRSDMTIDLGAADPLRFAFDVAVEPDGLGRFHGTGTSVVCVDEIPVTAHLRTRNSGDGLSVFAPSLRWTCRGTVQGALFVVTKWKLRTHGVRLKGDAASLSYAPRGSPTDRPDVVLVTVSGHPFPLPPPIPYLGVVYGPALAAEIEGLGLTVTEDDFVDAPTNTTDTGFAGLLARMQWVRDNWVAPHPDDPTAVVIVAHSHGGAWAHEAIRLVPDLPVAALVDLDTNSCGWSLVHQTSGPSGFDPEGAVIVDSVARDLEDVTWSHVGANLEIWSLERCPDPFVDEFYDHDLNVRPDGSRDGLSFYDSDETHTGVRTTAGASYGIVRAWLRAVLGAL